MDKPYYALAEGFINGAYRKVGDPVGRLSETQAKYLLLNGSITSQAPVPQDGKKGK